jgi:hypothetical protein
MGAYMLEEHKKRFTCKRSRWPAAGHPDEQVSTCKELQRKDNNFRTARIAGKEHTYLHWKAFPIREFSANAV